jgi:hypothetical protein
MLTSFFGKSNPVNFLILGILIFTGYVLAVLNGHWSELAGLKIAEYFVLVAICIFSMLLLDFIIRKNDLTKSNTYGVLFFSLFLLVLPVIFFDKNILLSNMFLLLALRRILSLKSEKNPEKKVLDATIWISLAAFFYVFALFFFIVLLMSILRKSHTTYKHLLIPFVGFLGILICMTAFQFLMFDSFDWFKDINASISLDFSVYNSLPILIPATIIITLIIWTSVYRIFKFSSVSKKDRPNYLLMLIITGTSIMMVLSSPEKTGAELLFLLAPTAIIAANYIENLNEFWFKEIVLWTVAILPLLMFFV